MNDRFDYKDYVRSLGIELIHQFDRAKHSTHSVAIGENKEVAVLKKLESILPNGVAVGRGFVFDISGTVSRQCDIILYERDYAIRCPINEDEKNCFYNIESVIAVGEIKSALSLREYLDCLTKFEQLANLKRFKYPNQNASFRKYLSSVSIVDVVDKKTNQLPRTDYDSVFRFVLCDKINVSFDEIVSSWEKRQSNQDSMFNIMIDLQGKYLGYCKENTLAYSPFNSNRLFVADEKDYTFNRFIETLCRFLSYGTTVPLNISAYSNLPTDIHYIESAYYN